MNIDSSADSGSCCDPRMTGFKSRASIEDVAAWIDVVLR